MVLRAQLLPVNSRHFLIKIFLYDLKTYAFFNQCHLITTIGMQAVMVPDKMVSEERRAEATIVLESLEQFKPELFGLPKFTD